MDFKSLVNQLSNRINQAHHMESVLRRFGKTMYNKGVEDSGKWISVEDELPKVNQKVLVIYYPTQPIMEGTTIGINHIYPLEVIKSKSKSNFDDNGFAFCKKVTHWMPLPKKLK